MLVVVITLVVYGLGMSLVVLPTTGDLVVEVVQPELYEVVGTCVTVVT